MQVVNTEGLALLGPGLEWFWSMAQFIVVAVSLIGLYLQLRYAGGQAAIAQLERFEAEWESERMLHHRLAIMMHLRDTGDRTHLPEAASSAVVNHWEKIATLARLRHIDRELVWDTRGTSCQVWWALVEPATRRERIDDGDPDLLRDFEWFAAFCARKDRSSGRGRMIDEQMLYRLRDAGIARIGEQLELERSIRASPRD